MADGVITIDTRMDTRGIDKGIGSLKKSLMSLGGLIGKAFSVVALAKFGKQAVDLASDITEVQNVVDTAFGEMSYKIEEFAKTSIENFGMSKLSAKQMASTYVAMARGMGQGLNTASDMAIEMTGRLGDISSFYNKTLSEVETIGRAVYSGETEPLKQIGVIMTEAQLQTFALSQGYKTLYKNMSASEKLYVRQQYFLNATSLAQGDFVKTQDSWANQTKILSERWKEFLSIVGSGLITVLTPLIQVINQILASLISLANGISKVLGAVFGKNSAASEGKKQADALAGSYTDVEDAIAGTGTASKKSAKQMKGMISNLDELNVINSQNNYGGAGGAGAADFSNIDAILEKTNEEGEEVPKWIDAVKKRLNELADLFKKGFFDGFGDTFKERIDNIKDNIASIKKSLKDIVTDPAVVSSFNRFLDSFSYNLGKVAGSFASIGITIAQNLTGGLAKYLSQNTERIKKYLVNMFDIKADTLDIIGNFAKSFAKIFEAFGMENGQQVTANLIGIFADALMGIDVFLSKGLRDISNVIAKPFIDNANAIQMALDGLLGVFSKVTGTIKDFVDSTVDAFNELYDSKIHLFFDDVASGLSELTESFFAFWNTYVNPLLSEMSDMFDQTFKGHVTPLINQVINLLGGLTDSARTLWNGALKPMLDWLISNVLTAITPIVKTIWKLVLDAISGIIDALSDIIKILHGLIEFITGVFSGDWNKAWNGISKIASGALNLIFDVVKTIMKAIGNIINSVLSAISSAFKIAFNSLVSLTKSIFNDIRNAITSNMNTTKNGITTVVNAIKTAWINGWSSLKSSTVSILRDLWNGMKGVINTIIAGVESMANAVVMGINTMLTSLNGLKVDIPKGIPGIGGTSIGFNIPPIPKVSIPRLASGAVIPPNNEFLAILGDQRQGTNIETPLSTMKQAFLEALSEYKQQVNVDVRLEGDAKGLFRVMREESYSYNRRTGKNAFTY